MLLLGKMVALAWTNLGKRVNNLAKHEEYFKLELHTPGIAQRPAAAILEAHHQDLIGGAGVLVLRPTAAVQRDAGHGEVLLGCGRYPQGGAVGNG